ncbi:hypothetical protein BDU57DRAFT_560034 [Ampelomyces quisqualis]|uniref:Fungal calcium binding protein domain-containing protein n=1 Tax=Ampelomyces quisqualis TaxID=50730 RepID=A0A6A5QBB9_AMPQU|nr:hypothetical protein BDU57DRAFT_560034 [Ampelomyces quisqualis]
MQFTISTMVAVFSSAAMAAPSAAVGSTSMVAQVEAFLAAKEATGCNKLRICSIAALAPTVVSCADALVELGLNPITDAACVATLATLANSAINTPESCAKC